MLCLVATALPAQTFATLLTFNGADGSEPEGVLVQGMDGNLYGTTAQGGTENIGTVFKITPSGAVTTLYSFCSQSGCAAGFYPVVGMVQAINGDF